MSVAPSSGRGSYRLTMSTDRTLRFGYQLSPDDDADPLPAAVRAESLGFDVVLVADHVGQGPAPMPTLGAVATVTDTIRIGTLVLNNDMRNPVQLAWEAAALDRLSAGRLELGLGAGHTPQEYAGTGIEMTPAPIRKERLAERVEIIRRLLDGESVDFDGIYYQLAGAQIEPAVQDRLPILVGGNGESLLDHAGAHADIVNLQGLGRTKSDGHRHSVKWSADWVTEQVDQVRNGAGERFPDVELSVLVQHVEITDDREAVLMSLCERVEGLRMEDASTIPYLMAGTTSEIVDHIHRCNGRWGISYFVVRDPAFARVLAAMSN